MRKYRNTETDEIIDSYDYNQLSSYEKRDYRECNDDGDFLTSAVIGAVTDSALLGGLLGGDLAGGILGDMLDGDLFD
jgi:hypothetical protein